MKKKIVYVTQWAARDSNKSYPHGWGFEPPIVEFSQDRDPVEVAQLCREHLSNEEFICIGATARRMIDGEFELLATPAPTVLDARSEFEIADAMIAINDNQELTFGYKHDVISVLKWVLNGDPFDGLPEAEPLKNKS